MLCKCVMVCAVYKAGTANNKTCQKWFEKLHDSDFSLRISKSSIKNNLYMVRQKYLTHFKLLPVWYKWT